MVAPLMIQQHGRRWAPHRYKRFHVVPEGGDGSELPPAGTVAVWEIKKEKMVNFIYRERNSFIRKEQKTNRSNEKKQEMRN